eukprot:gnl/TRDRNA2_/TRDRNA2_200256_c0_seq1.p1 gnl/TRDRNA2_/TRDRNA2_200256_c0~~gnl/TRDRNA2_/TRDRNA2_200256_c0_seq1.p1  ORF type:complete len:270 (+),score=30.18 gnl/TRDRNA2_/TRDRNA2_200256_c0_seq1:162-971(+)
MEERWCKECHGMLLQKTSEYCADCRHAWQEKCCQICKHWSAQLSKKERNEFPDGTFSLEGLVCRSCVPTDVGEDRSALCLAPLFKIWEKPTREESNEYTRNDSAPPQPACVLSWLFLGDLDDAIDVAKLKGLGITAVLSLCPEYHEEGMPQFLANHNIDFMSLPAVDDFGGRYNIVEKAWPHACRKLTEWKKQHRNVLVNCYGGVNRSCSLVLLWLMVCERWSFLESMRAVTVARGTALSNHYFRLQCWKLWCSLDGGFRCSASKDLTC